MRTHNSKAATKSNASVDQVVKNVMLEEMTREAEMSDDDEE